MSERRAFYCTHPDHGVKMPHYRIFLAPGEPEPPKCDVHEGRKMSRQVNVTYNAKRKKPT